MENITTADKIPVTVFTGYLGAGKTTVIINLVKQLSPKYKIVYIKNEFGSPEVDNLIAQESNLQVKEIINGCLCCILIGRLEEALLEVKEKYNPDRVIIETNGAAFPSPIAIEIRKLEDFSLDGIISVIDCLNFNESIVKDPVVKLQAEYTDLLLLNKSELVTEEKLDKIIDDLYEIAPRTPKVSALNGVINPSIVFGLDSMLEFKSQSNHTHQEYETVEINTDTSISKAQLESIIELLKKSEIWRAKGFLKVDNTNYLLNYVNRRYALNILRELPGRYFLTFIGTNTSFYARKAETILHNSVA
jgi:G3E family GTPase